jgi:hypothetical protein
MWRTISRLLLLVLIPSCASALAQDGPQTPKPNSSERKAIVNTLRAPVEKELKQKVVFRIRRVKVQNGWAFLQGVPQQPGGKPVNYRITRHQTAIEAGAFDDGILALLRKEKAGWRVVVYDIGSKTIRRGIGSRSTKRRQGSSGERGWHLENRQNASNIDKEIEEE